MGLSRRFVGPVQCLAPFFNLHALPYRKPMQQQLFKNSSSISECSQLVDQQFRTNKKQLQLVFQQCQVQFPMGLQNTSISHGESGGFCFFTKPILWEKIDKSFGEVRGTLSRYIKQKLTHLRPINMQIEETQVHQRELSFIVLWTFFSNSW